MIRKKTILKGFYFSLFIAAITSLTSCKKEDSTSQKNNTDGENSFTIDGKTYEATQVFYIESSNSIKAQRITPTSGLNEVETVSITFSDDELPTTGGSFDVVSDPYSPGNKDNNNQVSVLATTFPYEINGIMDDNTYLPSLSPVQQVTVSITANNKVNVKFSNISVKDITGKVTTISGNITQP
jgi:hypothetical protein